MIDRRRALRAIVLLCWSGFFAWLWISGEMTRYLGPRTYWVVIFGAVSLGAAAVAHLVTLRRSEGTTGIVASDAAGALVLLIPLLAVLIVPNAQLGAQAASRKASSGGFAAASLLPIPDPGEEISFREIHYASESAEYAGAAGIASGVEVELVGFVTHPAGAPGTFSLTRFYVSCCAADAIPYSVPISAPAGEGRSEDDWLRVTGTLVDTPDGWLLEATEISASEPPEEPYLY